MAPGHTVLTRMPRGAFSSEATFVRPMTACLAATYAALSGCGRKELTEPMLTIAPPLALLEHLRELVLEAQRDTLEVDRDHPMNSCSSSSASGWVSGVTAALLTAQSKRPKRSTAAGPSPRCPPRWRRPRAGRRRDRRRHGSPRRRLPGFGVDVGHEHARAPAAANTRAVASPMPMPAPVTIATLPSSDSCRSSAPPSLSARYLISADALSIYLISAQELTQGHNPETLEGWRGGHRARNRAAIVTLTGFAPRSTLPT